MQDTRYRYTQAEINLDALSHNVNTLKSLLNERTTFMGVIKANAYGHGSVQVANHLIREHQVNYLAVALLDEGIELREAGIDIPILVLSPVEIENARTAIKYDLTLTIFTTTLAEEINKEAKSLNKKAHVHLKVDSGMSRIGVLSKEEGKRILDTLDSETVNIEGIYTHFADADNMKDPSYTKKQFAQFKEIYTYLETQGYSFEYKHSCNTAATIRFPKFHLDMVRVGIGLYGYHADEAMVNELDLTPVMTVKSYLSYIKTLEANKSIGYGRTYTTNTKKIIGTIPIGYADGVPRYLSNQGHFIVAKQRAPIVGRVCMDQIMLDLTNIPSAKLEDEAVLFGDTNKGHPSLYDIAEMTYRFHYELLTNIHRRMPRKYVRK